MTGSRSLSLAAVLLLAAGGLHAWWLASSDDFFTFGAGVLLAPLVGLLAFGLLRARRGVAYLAFLASLVGGIVAVGGAATGSGTLPWTAAILYALAAMILFIVLWRPRAAAVKA